MWVCLRPLPDCRQAAGNESRDWFRVRWWHQTAGSSHTGNPMWLCASAASRGYRPVAPGCGGTSAIHLLLAVVVLLQPPRLTSALALGNFLVIVGFFLLCRQCGFCSSGSLAWLTKSRSNPSLLVPVACMPSVWYRP